MGAVVAGILVLGRGTFWPLLGRDASSFFHLNKLVACRDGLADDMCTAGVRHQVAHLFHVGDFDVRLLLKVLRSLLGGRPPLEVRSLGIFHRLLRELVLACVI